MGKPEKNLQEGYRQIDVDQVTIWQPDDVVQDEQASCVEITLTSFLFFKSLSVRGARATDCAPLPKGYLEK
jgi:hypothetical protein